MQPLDLWGGLYWPTRGQTAGIPLGWAGLAPSPRGGCSEWVGERSHIHLLARRSEVRGLLRLTRRERKVDLMEAICV